MKLAIDIGTTTIGLCLFDINTKFKKTTTFTNPGRIFGSDVISRMNNSVKQNLGKKIKSLTSEKIIEVFSEQLCPKSSDISSFEELDEIIIAANTPMTHLFMGWDVSGMLDAPFAPYSLDSIQFDWNGVPAVFFPGISAFVGGDIVSGLYCLDLDKLTAPELFVDLGTNGEIVLCLPDGLIATSVAAGPAFEGGNISCGTSASNGAIDSVFIKNGFCRLTTIGDFMPPKGLCGSGIIDTVCELCKDGIIDEHGTFVSYSHRADGFCLYPTSFANKPIILTQDDIRNFQIAKAAVCAGILTLIKHADISASDIHSLHIAGSFGKYINIKNAAATGIIPDFLSDKSTSSGNTSLLGAVKFASHPEDFTRIKKIASLTDSVSLADSDAFKDAYIKSMDLSFFSVH